VRTADGTLWVVFVRPNGVLEDLVVRPVLPNGTLGAEIVVQAGWGGLSMPAIVLLPDGQLRVFFSGIRAAFTGDPFDGLTYATSSGGAAWVLAGGTIDYRADGSSAWAGDVSAALLPSGTAFQTWWGSSGVWVHRDYAGAAGTQFEYSNGQLGGGFGYYSDLAADADGTVWLAWAANVTGKQGVWAQQVNAGSGAPVGSPVKLPASSTAYDGRDEFDMMLTRVPLAVRAATAGGGVYAAYPTGYPTPTKVRLWRLGAVTGKVVAAGAGAKRQVAVAADPGGRIWVVWCQASVGGRATIRARRSDPNAKAFGATVTVPAPKGKDTVYHLAASAQTGRLDVFAHLGPQEATWHTQLLAALTVSVSPAKLKTGTKATVVVAVRDAGQPLAGATVKLGGKSAKTDPSGKAKLALGPFAAAKTVKGTVKMPGYAAAQVSVTVRRR
jgi:hypothetical protein